MNMPLLFFPIHLCQLLCTELYLPECQVDRILPLQAEKKKSSKLRCFEGADKRQHEMLSVTSPMEGGK